MHMKAADKAEFELLFGHLKEGGDEVDIKDGDNRFGQPSYRHVHVVVPQRFWGWEKLCVICWAQYSHRGIRTHVESCKGSRTNSYQYVFGTIAQWKSYWTTVRQH